MDMEALMAQAAELQSKVNDAQEQLGQTIVKGIAANGACVVDMTCKYDVKNIVLRPEVLAQGAENVAKIVMAAYQDAKQKADVTIDKVMGDVTQGIPM